ncbi:unnamed protein product [Schistosoma margrebowiei]|uniref:non-specific serine/threonine protein kinase n=1 Tax=Schistosoma margrebowiei TaxID=48269 RepID=A0AA85ABV8_9TREM|nr:unnamed protein product [Schistosoma margrebowiei]
MLSSRPFVPKKSTITSEYTITNNVLGLGITGKVMQCIHNETGVHYALKILEDNQKSRREAEIHWRVSDCPHIVKVVDVFENTNQNTKKNYLLMVMEYMRGGELFNKIKECENFTESEAAKIVYQISSAIAYLHERNIAHRDLKPENLLYTSNENGAILKLTDFGFAKEVVTKKSLQTPCYTPYYVPPEILNFERYDKSCDIWSLGIITYILLSGCPPFFSQNGQPISPGMKSKIRAGKYDFPDAQWKYVSKSAKDLIKSLLLTEPDRRPTIREVMNNHWVAQHNDVPNTPLGTSVFFTTKAWDQFREMFRESLQTKRKENSNVPTLMTLDASKNPLLIKRKINQKSNPENNSHKVL